MELNDDVYKKIVDEFYSRVSDETEFVLKVEPTSMSFIPCKPFRAYREENNMKYEIRIEQPGRYGTETIKGEFDNGSEAEAFVETVLEHFQNVTAEITAVASNMPEDEGADE